MNDTSTRSRIFPLWLTLVSLMLVLVGLGILVSDAIVTFSFQRSVMHRIDDEITGVAQRIAQRPVMPPIPPGKPLPPLVYPDSSSPDITSAVQKPSPSAGPNPLAPSEDLNDSELSDSSPEFPIGSVAMEGASNSRYYLSVGGRVFGKTRSSEGISLIPQIPENLNELRTPRTVSSHNGSRVQWRAVGMSSAHGDIVVATELTEVNDNLSALLTLQLAISTGVLLVIGLAGYFLVRWSLRPLVEVEQTAHEIASGNLERRVPDWGERTEVGRLSTVLNSMLSQIQQAFAATQASEERAIDSERRMRQFIADASHELRTPLTAIRGFAELHRKGLGVNSTIAMARVESEAIRMGKLVEDLLSLARTDEQRPLEQEPVDMLELMTDALHDAKAIAPQRTVLFHFHAGSGVPVVLGDESALRQVLSNLVSNALAHTGDEAQVTLWLSGDDKDVLFEVRDTGAGLSPEDSEHIFERFYRVDPSRTRESGGSGLGLAIVDSLVRAHHGQVTVRSEIGEGTALCVRIPRLSLTDEDEDLYLADEDYAAEK